VTHVRGEILPRGLVAGSRRERFGHAGLATSSRVAACGRRRHAPGNGNMFYDGRAARPLTGSPPRCPCNPAGHSVISKRPAARRWPSGRNPAGGAAGFTLTAKRGPAAGRPASSGYLPPVKAPPQPVTGVRISGAFRARRTILTSATPRLTGGHATWSVFFLDPLDRALARLVG